MKKQVLNISPLQTANVIAVLWFVFTLPFVPFFLSSMPDQTTPYIRLLVFALPLLYAAFGFLSALLGAWVYNALAKRIGGIEFTTQDVLSEAMPGAAVIAGIVRK